jgi:hypothetical protein
MQKVTFTILLALAVAGIAAAQNANPAQGETQPAPQAGTPSPGGHHGNWRQGGEGRWRGGPGVFGQVSSVGVNSFVVKGRDGSTSTVTVNEQTKYLEDQKSITLEDLKPGDFVMVRRQAPQTPAGGQTGEAQAPAASSQALTAQMVRRLTPQQVERMQSMQSEGGERVFGEIKAVNGNQITVHNPRTNSDTVVTVNGQTTFMKQGAAATISDFKVGDRMAAIGQSSSGQFIATRVMSGRPMGAPVQGEP